MAANDLQFGGVHYKGSDYQHWDLMNDLRMPYLPATASKYLRWRKKNGVEDLEKLCHYLQKTIECNTTLLPVPQDKIYQCFWRYAISNGVHMVDCMILFYIITGEFAVALEQAQTLLAAEQGAEV